MGAITGQNSYSGITYDLLDIYIASTTEAWILSSKGVFLYTDDGGKHWVTQNRETADYLYDGYIIDAQNTFGLEYHHKTRIGYVNGAKAEYWQSRGGYGPWKYSSTSVSDEVRRIERLNDMHFISTTEAWAVGHSGDTAEFTDFYKPVILHTTDGGKNWTVMYRDDGMWNYVIYDVFQISSEGN